MRCTPVETGNEQSLSTKVSLLNMENSWKIIFRIQVQVLLHTEKPFWTTVVDVMLISVKKIL